MTPQSETKSALITRALADAAALFLLSQSLPATTRETHHPTDPLPSDRSFTTSEDLFSTLSTPRRPHSPEGTHAPEGSPILEFGLLLGFALGARGSRQEKETSASLPPTSVTLGSGDISLGTPESIREYLRSLPSGFTPETINSHSPLWVERLPATLGQTLLLGVQEDKITDRMGHFISQVVEEGGATLPILCTLLHDLHEILEDQMHIEKWDHDDPRYQCLLELEREYAVHSPLLEAVDMQDGFIVEQGEIGFSETTPLSTWNLHECVALAVRNDRTGKMFLAHLDYDRDLHGLADALERLGTVASDQVSIRIVGAKYDQGPEECEQTLASRTTLHRVLTELDRACAAKEIQGTIVSAQVCEEDQPTALTIDPISFSLCQGTVSASAPDIHLRRAVLILDEWDTELKRGPDLLNPEAARTPIILSPTAHSRLQELLFVPDGYLLSERMHDEFFTGWPKDHVLRWKFEVREIRTALQESYSSLFADITPQEEHLKLLRELPIAVGEGSEVHNRALRELIFTTEE